MGVWLRFLFLLLKKKGGPAKLTGWASGLFGHRLVHRKHSWQLIEYTRNCFKISIDHLGVVSRHTWVGLAKLFSELASKAAEWSKIDLNTVDPGD